MRNGQRIAAGVGVIAFAAVLAGAGASTADAQAMHSSGTVLSAPQAAGCQTLYYITGNSVRIHRDPALNSPRIGFAFRRDVVLFENYVPGWYQFNDVTEGVDHGWISEQYVNEITTVCY
jgi:hypothetical protein